MRKFICGVTLQVLTLLTSAVIDVSARPHDAGPVESGVFCDETRMRKPHAIRG